MPISRPTQESKVSPKMRPIWKNPVGARAGRPSVVNYKSGSIGSATAPLSVAVRGPGPFGKATAFVLYGMGLLLILTVSSYVTWGTGIIWFNSKVFNFALLCSTAYLGAIFFNSFLGRLPRAEGFGVVFVSVTLSFLLLLAALALGRLFYARSFLLSEYVLSMIWLTAINYIRTRPKNQRLAVIPGGFAAELLKLPATQWLPLEHPQLQVGVNGVAVDFHQKFSPEWINFLADCTLKGMPIYHAAIIYEAYAGRVPIARLSEELLNNFYLSPTYGIIKRAFDLLVIFAFVPILIPSMLLLAVAIRIDSPGPIIFGQKRVGRGWKPFYMLKFRSMKQTSNKEEVRFAEEDDQRITRVGRLMRKLRLDELPQLWNVFRGQMSLIGPRPEQIPFARKFKQEIPFYVYRHLVRPGITGWAQVNHGYAADADQTRVKLEYDLYYIKHQSLGLDALILFRTATIVLTGFGAR